jgi:hypothetical protein
MHSSQSTLYKKNTVLYSSHHAAINGNSRGRLRVEPKGAEFSRSVGCGLEDQYVGWLVRRFATRAKMQPTKNWRSSALPNACRTRSQAACRPAAIRGVQNQHHICQAAVRFTPAHNTLCQQCISKFPGFPSPEFKILLILEYKVNVMRWN